MSASAYASERDDRCSRLVRRLRQLRLHNIDTVYFHRRAHDFSFDESKRRIEPATNQRMNLDRFEFDVARRRVVKRASDGHQRSLAQLVADLNRTKQASTHTTKAITTE
jgi:hypothetical protein